MLDTQKSPKILRKSFREVAVAFSKLRWKSFDLLYNGLKIKIPMIYGMGRHHLVPDFSPWLKRILLCNKDYSGNKAVLDVGANVGQFLLNSKSVNPDTAYYGFEPNPPCIFYLYELIRYNKFKNTFVFPVALANENSASLLHSYGYDSGTSSLVDKFSPTREGFSTNVTLVKGSSFIKNIPDIKEIGFIKIDVEGYEFDVLKGLSELIKEQQPLIYCEVLTDIAKVDFIKNIKTNVFEFCQSLGYEIYKADKDFFPVKVTSIEDFSSKYAQDYLFVAKDKLDFIKKLKETKIY